MTTTPRALPSFGNVDVPEQPAPGWTEPGRCGSHLRSSRSVGTLREPCTFCEAMNESSPSAGTAPAEPSSMPGSLRLGAYLLLGDPAFLEQSIRSIYAIAERIVVVYDEAGLSWTSGRYPSSTACPSSNRMDTDDKVVLLPGNFHDTGLLPLEAETLERNAAIAALGHDVDWVVQLDTDEVLGSSPPVRRGHRPRPLRRKVRPRLSGPLALRARGGQLYLERCRRTWGISAGYPGPTAVKAGTALELARQCDVPIWRIDFRRRNTDPAHPRAPGWTSWSGPTRESGISPGSGPRSRCGTRPPPRAMLTRSTGARRSTVGWSAAGIPA